MANKLYVGLAIAVFCLGFTALISAQEKPVTEACLGCICEAISGCNQSASCYSGVCGPFRISWAYWSDAGQLTINNESPSSETAHANCANDADCAANTIQNYMTKFGQDCNSDMLVNCYDYAAIHKLGGYACNGELSDKYLNALTPCLNFIYSVNGRNN